MQHVDPETLALLALGENDAAAPDEHDHLRSCHECQAELAALGDAAAVGRSLTDEDRLVAPSASVWEGVCAELGLGEEDDAEAEAGAGTEAGVEDEADDSEESAATVTDLGERRRRRYSAGWIAAAASVALVVGVGGGVLWERRDLEEPAGTTTVASATLDALPDWDGATGAAQLEESEDGRRQVVVSMDAPASDDGYHEVWLIADDLSGLVSLGVLEGDEGTFDIPEGLDVGDYPLVDVSEEHFDGDPSHSGDSIVRGGLQI